MKRPALLITVSIFIILILSIAKTVVSNRLSTTGIVLEKTESELNSYKTQNLVLREKLLAMSSLTNIASKAALLGFVENKSQVILTKPLPLAIKQ
ncbi:MAG: hypothetical protein M1372_00720 [Patescibacteria group bacterium]|nr:hypothetical protein [Patescibacteria group bacterium]